MREDQPLSLFRRARYDTLGASSVADATIWCSNNACNWLVTSASREAIGTKSVAFIIQYKLII